MRHRRLLLATALFAAAVLLAFVWWPGLAAQPAALLSVALLAASFALALLPSVKPALRRRPVAQGLHGNVLFDSSQAPMLLIDPDTERVVDANPVACTYYGYQRSELADLPLTAINQMSAAEIRAEVAAARHEQRHTFRFRHRMASGEIRDVEVFSGPIDVDGRTRLLSIIHDVTERTQLERRLLAESNRLAALMTVASDGIHVLTVDGDLVEHSDSFASMLGRQGYDLRGLNVRTWDANVPQPELGAFVAGLTSGSTTFETRWRTADNRIIDVEISSRGFVIDGIPHLYATGRDITERKKVEQEQRIAATTFESQQGLMVTDERTIVLRVNRAFSAITGYPAEEIIGRSPALLRSGRHDEAFYRAMWRSIRETGSWQGEIWNRRKGGEVFPELLTITAVRDDAGKVTHFVGAFADITRHKAAESEIEHLAFYDPLTALPNRRLLLDRLRRGLAASARSRAFVGLFFIDLDDFKTLNDTLGHDFGDLLLQQTAGRLRECVRDEDTVSRLGGDEFVVMIEDLSSDANRAATQAEAVARKILEAMNRPYQLSSQEYRSTPSIGITVVQGSGDSVEVLLKRADLAMYQAKAAGKNTLCFFDPAMQAVVERRASLESELRRALSRGELSVHYQPQVTGEGVAVGVEALLRWHSPERGLTLPGEFIALAEETGLILPIGRAVLESACRQLAVWAQQPALAHLSIAVNVSARQFHHPDFLSEVTTILERTAAPVGRLQLELTESILLRDVDDVIRTMAALRARGLTFSLDDFGTGYSSLAYLKRMPLDCLKIDQSFVRDIFTDPNDAAIVGTIIALADHLGLGVTAEGVETEEQRQYLARLGCTTYQGFLFSRPLDVAACETWINEQAQSRGPGST